MVEAAPSCALLGGFAIGARVALLWQHNANPSYKLAFIPRYGDIVRTAGWAGSARAAGRRPPGDGWCPKTARCIRKAGAASDRPLMGGVLNITAAVWTAGFHWWRSGNKKRTQNVSEYMLVLALCLVVRAIMHRLSKDTNPLLSVILDHTSLAIVYYRIQK